MQLLNKVIQKYRNIKLRNKLTLLFSVFISIPVIVLGTVFLSTLNFNMYSYEERHLSQSMTQLNDMIDYFFEIHMNQIESVHNNIALQRIITRRNLTVIERIEDARTIFNILNPIISEINLPEIRHSRGRVNLELFVSDTEQTFTEVLKNADRVNGEDWYIELMSGTNRFIWSHYIDQSGNSSITISRRFTDFNTMYPLGAIRLSISTDNIETALRNTVGDSNISLLYTDEFMRPIAYYGNGFTEHGDLLIDIAQNIDTFGIIETTHVRNDEYLVSSIISNINDYRLIYFVPMEVVNENIGWVTITMLIILILAIGICILITSILSSLITKRVNVLTLQASRIEAGDFEITRETEGNDELGLLEEHLCKMADNLKGYIQREYLSEVMIHRIKSELIQEQINPHLLYNTLAFLSYSAKTEGNQDLSELVDHLVGFYKGVLNRGGITSSIKEELDMVKAYISIVSVVYELDLNVVYDVDESLLPMCSLKLLLQPIVENAIIHGIKPNKCGKLTISCVSDIEKDEMIITVTDDGIGMEKHEVESIQQYASGGKGDKGYGLKNIIQRMRAFFGDSYKISVVSIPWEGTTVCMHIPIMTEEDMNDLMTEMKMSNENGS